MKKLFFIGCVSLTFGFSVFGQTTKADLEHLRKEVGLPASVSIAKTDVSFPAAKPLKIYLAIKHDKKSAKDFVNWAEKWNKTNAAQFGEIQIVDDVNDADVAAVQYQFGAARIVREESAQLKIGKGKRQSETDDKFVVRGVGNSNARIEDSARTLTLPLYSYLIVRGRNSAWAINYSRVDERVSDKNFPELLLQSAIENELKNR